MFAEVVALCYQHCVVLLTECHNFRKHNQSPVTNFLETCCQNSNTMVQPISFSFTELAIINSDSNKKVIQGQGTITLIIIYKNGVVCG